jgi:hypothetical protein
VVVGRSAPSLWNGPSFCVAKGGAFKTNMGENWMNRIFCILSLAIMASAMGCGGKPSVGGTETVDATQVSNTISGLTDAAQDPAKLGKLFVTAPDAATAAKYKDYLYYQGAKPTVTGTTAKVKMRLEKPAGTLAGEPEWEFEKAGDVWKIKSAPLP